MKKSTEPLKIVFLDIDGVLNSSDFFASNCEEVKKFKYDLNDTYMLLKRQMMDIDYKKVAILKEIINETDAKVVITSSWKKLKIFPYVMCNLICEGIPIIDITHDKGYDRGTGIKKYLLEHDVDVDGYVILDDDIFNDYDEEIINKLVKTSFYHGGLEEKHAKEIIKKLK